MKSYPCGQPSGRPDVPLPTPKRTLIFVNIPCTSALRSCPPIENYGIMGGAIAPKTPHFNINYTITPPSIAPDFYRFCNPKLSKL